MSINKNLECPKCGYEIDVEGALYAEAKEKLEKEFADKEVERRNKHKVEVDKLAQERQEFSKKKEQENELFLKKVEQEKKKIKEEAVKKAEEEHSVKMKALQEDLIKQKSKNQGFQEMELKVAKMEETVAEEKAKIALQIQKGINDKREEILKQAKKNSEEESGLKIKELQKQLEDQKKHAEEAIRKAEQGSMQLQGEVQELALEEMLKLNYPFDIIEEVKKGARGADCVQTVRNKMQQSCGKIVYESKRTQNWSNDWVAKVKEDMRRVNADIGVIVTQQMPKEIDSYGLMDGVWVCNYRIIKEFSLIVREMILKVSNVKITQDNKESKMGMLYDFLTSEEFRQQTESIVTNWKDMKDGIDKERNAMNRAWKQREKQLEKIIIGTTDMFGSIKGIAGNAIGTIDQLELPSGDGELDL